MASRRFSTPVLVISFASALLVVACGGSDVPDAPDGGAPDSGVPDGTLDCPSPAPAPEDCDLFLSCGCAADQKCTVGMAGKHCVDLIGTKQPGDPCGGDGECVEGTICATYGGELRCLQYCDDAHMCPAGDACYIAFVDDMGNQLGMACGQACGLLDQDCDFADQGCYGSAFNPVMEDGICVTAGTGTTGDSCSFANDCLEGFTCVDAAGGGASTCRKYCDRTDMMPGCEATETCDPLAGETQTGVCMPT